MTEPKAWNYQPTRPPKIGTPVLVVKGDERRTFVREATYQGRGYWQGFGNAPVLAWRPLPYTPITLALKAVLDERDALLGFRPRTSKQQKRLLQLDVRIEIANRARESEYERFIREAALALRIVGSGTL